MVLLSKVQHPQWVASKWESVGWAAHSGRAGKPAPSPTTPSYFSHHPAAGGQGSSRKGESSKFIIIPLSGIHAAKCTRLWPLRRETLQDSAQRPPLLQSPCYFQSQGQGRGTSLLWPPSVPDSSLYAVTLLCFALEHSDFWLSHGSQGIL